MHGKGIHGNLSTVICSDFNVHLLECLRQQIWFNCSTFLFWYVAVSDGRLYNNLRGLWGVWLWIWNWRVNQSNFPWPCCSILLNLIFEDSVSYKKICHLGFTHSLFFLFFIICLQSRFLVFETLKVFITANYFVSFVFGVNDLHVPITWIFIFDGLMLHGLHSSCGLCLVGGF